MLKNIGQLLGTLICTESLVIAHLSEIGLRKRGGRESKMIVMVYWELNPDLDPTEIVNVAQKLVSKGLYPSKGVKTIAWYVSVGDYWGINIDEVENEAAYLANVQQYRMLKPGIFKVFKSTLAVKAEDAMPLISRLAKQIKAQ